MKNHDWWHLAEAEIIEIAENHVQNLRGSTLDVKKILKRKNPYLYSVYSTDDPRVFAEMIVDAYLPSSFETKFGNLLEEIAIIVCEYAKNGQKSSTGGIDLEYGDSSSRTIVQVKSGPNWGNAGQKRKLVDNFNTAQRILRQSSRRLNVRCVEGCCYGHTKIQDMGSHLKIVGDAFWEEISGEQDTAMRLINCLSSNIDASQEIALLKNNTIDILIDKLIELGIVKNSNILWNELLNYVNKK